MVILIQYQAILMDLGQLVHFDINLPFFMIRKDITLLMLEL
jgi:hypothetical protein